MNNKANKSEDLCELCGEAASLYCAADSAFLCFLCDRQVHTANFLVARHVRRLIPGSGSGSDPSPSSSSSPSASCVSTSSPPPPSRKPAAEREIEIWTRRIRMTRIAGEAEHALLACAREMSVLPPRASLAAAIFYAAKIGGGRGGRTCEEVLRRLERCSGVPARAILAAESRIARAVRRKTRANVEEEGWSECS